MRLGVHQETCLPVTSAGPVASNDTWTFQKMTKGNNRYQKE